MKIKDLGAILVMFLFVLANVGTASAELYVETDVSVMGNYVMCRELSLQTNSGYYGIKFDDDFWTPSLGMYGPSNVSLEESIVLVTGKDSALDVSGAFDGENIKTDACLRNYDIGTRQSNQYSGNSIVDFSWQASNMSSEMVFTGDFFGKQRSTILVRNLTCPHDKIYDEDFTIKGKAVMDLSSIIHKPVCVGEGDWLGCP